MKFHEKCFNFIGHFYGNSWKVSLHMTEHGPIQSNNKQCLAQNEVIKNCDEPIDASLWHIMNRMYYYKRTTYRSYKTMSIFTFNITLVWLAFDKDSIVQMDPLLFKTRCLATVACFERLLLVLVLLLLPWQFHWIILLTCWNWSTDYCWGRWYGILADTRTNNSQFHVMTSPRLVAIDPTINRQHIRTAIVNWPTGWRPRLPKIWKNYMENICYVFGTRISHLYVISFVSI